MTFEIAWTATAVHAAAGYLTDDPEGLRALVARLDDLATDPRPYDAVDVGSPDVQRLRFADYRVLYEIVDPERRLTILHLRRLT